MDTYASLESVFDRVHMFTEQLSLFTRPITLSMTLPFLGEPSSRSSFPYPPFSPRTVLAKDYTQILKEVDGLWFKVGLQLHGFGQSIDETVVLSSEYIFVFLKECTLCYLLLL